MKTALVTGASRGIGAETARELARRGYAVVLAARSETALNELASELSGYGVQVLVVPTDVRDRQQLRDLARKAIERFEGIDILIHNAGIAHPGVLVSQLTDEQLHSIIATNLMAPIELTRALLPSMTQRGRGHIGFVDSLSGYIASPSIAIYTTTKFALRGFAGALRRELLGTGIEVSIISPGVVNTDMAAPARDALRVVPIPWGTPQKVARVIVKTLMGPSREIIVPGYLRVLVWFDRHFPFLMDMVARTYLKKGLPHYQSKPHGD